MMKVHLLMIAFTVSCLIAASQQSKIDSLAQKINNNQLRGECHYAWFLEMNSKAGIELWRIGKPATATLLSLLKDSSRALIAHYILSNIWVKYVESWSSFENFQKDSSVLYGYNRLNFYERKGKWFVKNEDLVANKEKWLEFLKKARH